MKKILAFLFATIPIFLFAQTSANFTANSAIGCDYLTVNFSDLSSGAIKAWKWNFGNGNSSTLKNPTVVYSSPGKYTVSLSVTDSSNTTSVLSKQDYIVVYNPATVDFSGNKAGGCTPLDVSFTDLSVDGDTTIQSWKWDFGDGTFSYQQNTSHIYTTIAGSYQVSLEVTDDNGCLSKKTKSSFITLTNPPSSFFSIDSSQLLGCSIPYTIAVSNTGSTSNTYVWDFGDGNISTQQNTNHTYTAYGTYNVSLSATNIYGCSSSYGTGYWYITVIPFQADFTVDSTVTCQNMPLQFSDNSSSSSVAWFWNFGDGNSIYSVYNKDTLWFAGTDSIVDTLYTFPIQGTYQQPNYTFDTVGTFSVTLYAYDTIAFANKRCMDSLSQTISVLPLPAINFTVDDSSACKIPFLVQFTDYTPAALSWVWDLNFNLEDSIFIADTASSSTILNYSFTNAGYYSIALAITNATGCSDTLIKDSLVQVLFPNAEPYASGYWNDTTHTDYFPDYYYQFSGCAPATIPFTDVSFANESISYWHWTFGEPSTFSLDTSLLQNPTHFYTDSGYYKGSLYIETISGCKDSTYFYVFIGKKPTAKFFVDNDTACHGGKVIFIDSSSSNVNHWAWQIGTTAYFDTLFKWDYVLDTLVIEALDTSLFYSFDFENLNADSFSYFFKDTGYFAASLITYHYNCPSDISLLDSMVYILAPHPEFTTTNLTIHLNPEAPPDFVFCPSHKPPYTVILNNLSYSTHHWYWDFGDPSAGAANYYDGPNPPPFTYAQKGNYTITLTAVNDTTGCTDTYSVPVLWSDIEAKIGIDSTLLYQQCLPANLEFLNATTSTHELTYWGWYFTDGYGPIYYDLAFYNSEDSIMHEENNIYANEQTHGTYLNPVHNYTSPGLFSVYLWVSNEMGCSSKDTFDVVEIYPQPTIGFTTDITSGCVPITVNFIDTSLSPSSLTNWTWNFGDKKSGLLNSSTLENPSHEYQDTGRFDISLIIVDQNGCSDTLRRDDYILGSRAAAKFILGQNYCYYDMIQPTDNSSGYGLDYFWDFGDGTTSTDPSPTHQYSLDSTKDYTVQLLVVDTNGCDSSYSSVIKVQRPISYLKLGDMNGNCPPFFATVYDSSFSVSSSIAGWQFYFGDGTTTVLNSYTEVDTISHVYNLPGTYDITLITRTSNNCYDTLFLPDAVTLQGPQAEFTFNPFEGCPPLDVTFVPSNTLDVATYYWVFGDGYTSTGDTVVHTYDHAGNYIPTLIITDSLNTLIGDTETCTITILADTSIYVPGPEVSFEVGMDTACKGDVVHFTNYTDSTDINYWIWYFGDGNSTTLNSPSYMYDSSGTFDVSLYGYTYLTTDTCIYYYTETAAVTIFKSPEMYVANQYEIGCPPVDVLLYIDSQSVNYSISSYAWNFNNQTSIDSMPLFTVSNTDSFPVYLTIEFANGCEENYMDTFQFMLYTLPTANFSIVAEQNSLGAYKETIQLNNSSQNATHYLWDFGDGQKDSTENPIHSYTSDGMHAIQLIAYSDSGCTDTLLIPLNIYFGPEVPNTFSPNGDGINDVLQFALNGESAENLSLIVYDRWGKVIYKNEDYKNNWDGRNENGELVPADTYYYIFTYQQQKVWAGWIRIF